MVQILVLRSVSLQPKCTETDVKLKSTICPILGQSDPRAKPFSTYSDRSCIRGGMDLGHFPGARRAMCIQSSFRSFLSIYIFFSLFVNGLPFYVKSNPLIQLLKPVISPVSPVTFDMLTSSCQQVCKIDDKQTCAFRGTTTVYVNNRHSQC